MSSGGATVVRMILPGLVILCSSVSAEEDSAVSRPELKRAALASFSFTETPAPVAGVTATEKKDVKASEDDSLVVMDKMKVSAKFWDRDLDADIHKTVSLKPINSSKFGTGLHQKDFGKVRGSVVTVLYVPIMIGISW